MSADKREAAREHATGLVGEVADLFGRAFDLGYGAGARDCIDEIASPTHATDSEDPLRRLFRAAIGNIEAYPQRTWTKEATRDYRAIRTKLARIPTDSAVATEDDTT